MINLIANLISNFINRDKIQSKEELVNLMTSYGVKTPNELLSNEMPPLIREQASQLIKGALGVDMPKKQLTGISRLDLASKVSNPSNAPNVLLVNTPIQSTTLQPPLTIQDYQRQLAGAEVKEYVPSKETIIKNTLSEIKQKEEKSQQMEAGTNYHRALTDLISKKKGIVNITTSDINDINSLHPLVDPQDRIAIQTGVGLHPQEVFKNEQFTIANNNLQDALKKHIPLTMDWFSHNMVPYVGLDKGMSIIQDFIPKATKGTLNDMELDIINKFIQKKPISPQEQAILRNTLAMANPLAGLQIDMYMQQHYNELNSTDPQVREQALRGATDEYLKIINMVNLPGLNETPNKKERMQKPSPKIKVDKPVKGQVYKEKPKSDYIYENGIMKPTR